VFKKEAVGVKSIICWCPGEFPIQVIDSRFDNWARVQGDISLALKESYLDSSSDSIWYPNNIKWCSCGKDLIASWRSYTIKELSESKRTKSQNGGGRNE